MPDRAERAAVAANAAPWDAQDASQRQATLTRILVRLSREALQGDDLHTILKGICECLVAELPIAIASVILLDAAGHSFTSEVYAGELSLLPPAGPGADAWSATIGVAGRCVRMGGPQLVEDVSKDPDYVAGNPLVRSEYLVPIRHGSRIHGVLNIESTRTDLLRGEALEVFDAVADLVAGAIHFARTAEELKSANRKLQLLSMIDGLTGIANRRRFDQQLRGDWQRLAAEQRPLALMMVDADAFKPLNDTRGHLYGDECLRTLARICSGFVEERAGLVARFGGEELALLLPDCDMDRTVALAEALRAAVEAEAMPHPASPVSPHVTVSVGVAVWTPLASRPPELLVAAADAAMYAAKRLGRNRVVSRPVE